MMMFIQVPEEKSTKNRVHLDLETDDREGEVERFVGLAAAIQSEHDQWGVQWMTLTGPKGNEFLHRLMLLTASRRQRRDGFSTARHSSVGPRPTRRARSIVAV